MRQFRDLPKPSARELRLERTTRDELGAAVAGLATRRDRERRQAVVAGVTAALLGVAIVRLPLAQLLQLTGDTVEVGVGAIAVVLGVVAILRWERAPQLDGAEVLGETLRQLGGRVRDAFALSVSWEPGRAEGPFEDTRTLLCGELADGTAFALGVDVVVSVKRRTSYVPSGVGVAARRTRTATRSVSAWLECADGHTARVAPDAPLTAAELVGLFPTAR